MTAFAPPPPATAPTQAAIQAPGQGPMRWQPRPAQPQWEAALQAQGAHPLLARLWAARGVRHMDEVTAHLKHLLNPNTLLGMGDASQALAQALLQGQRIVVVGDYDCDGATATAVAVRGLRMLLAALGKSEAVQAEQVQFVVPNRFEYGYGLSPDIVDLAHRTLRPDLLVTVDNGIASVEGVAHANALGLRVVVTDHHLPGPALPAALAIVNPNQVGCPFASKSMAGVGVMFYVLLGVRAWLREHGHFEAALQPRLDALLDLVALGTVADVVRLDANNRRLVEQGLQRIRTGLAQPGVLALFYEAGRDPRKASAADLGFMVGPRLNAAGRLADMAVGVRALITNDAVQAAQLAAELASMNETRKQLEAEMRREAMAHLENLALEGELPMGLVVHHPSWHQGVIGIVASRIKDRYHRPVLALANGDEGWLKGSGRSVPGVHLRDVLDWVCKHLPAGAMPKFGGHAMAAGLTLRADALQAFTQAFAQGMQVLAGGMALTPVLEHDGSLPVGYATAQVADLLLTQVWGQGFPAPVFVDEFQVLSHRLLKDQHSKWVLRREGQTFTALRWGHVQALPASVRLAYRLERDTFNGNDAVQLVVEGVEENL